jgi:hypothetical protein
MSSFKVIDEREQAHIAWEEAWQAEFLTAMAYLHGDVCRIFQAIAMVHNATPPPSYFPSHISSTSHLLT